jgi:hypothetical protein
MGVTSLPLTPTLSSFGKLRTVSLSNRTVGRGRIRKWTILGFAMTGTM